MLLKENLEILSFRYCDTIPRREGCNISTNNLHNEPWNLTVLKNF